MWVPLVLGLFAAVVSTLGLVLCNGGLALGMPWVGAAFTALVSGALAALAATSRPSGSRRAALIVAALGGLLIPLLGAPNGPVDNELGLDRYFLAPPLVALCGGWNQGVLAYLLTSAASLAGGLAVLALSRRVMTRLILAAVVGSFLLAAASLNLNPRLAGETREPPVKGQYVMDGFLWLRLHDLMQQGQPYYKSFYDACVDRKGPSPPTTWFNWRPPLLFFLWDLVPGGPRGLLVCFWFLAAGTLVTSWAATRILVDEGVALLSPILLGAYFMYAAVTPWFPSQEYWGCFFMIAGLWAWLGGRAVLGALMWALATTFREHFAFLIPVMLYMAWRQSGGPRKAALAAVVFWALVYAVHYHNVAPYVQPGKGALDTWKDAGPSFVYKALRFGTVYLASRDLVTFPLLFCGICGAWLAGRARLMLSAIIWMPLIALFFVGGDRTYWGVVVVPQILLCVPLITRAQKGGSMKVLRWLTRFALYLLGVLLVLEVGLRCAWSNPDSGDLPSRGVLLKENQRGADVTGSYQGKTFHFQTDPDGLVWPSRTVPDHAYVLAFMGDSTVEAAGLPAECRWTNLVVDRLRQAGWLHADELNDAHAGATARDAVELFYNKDGFYHPPILLYSSGFTDLAYNMVKGGDAPRLLQAQTSQEQAQALLRRYCYLFAYLHQSQVAASNPVAPVATKVPYYEVDCSQALADYRRNLIILVQLAKQYGCRVYLLTQPSIYGTGLMTREPQRVATIFYRDGGLSEASLEKAMNQINQVIGEVGQAEQVGVIPASEAVGKDESNFIDEVHLTQAGQERVAECVYARLTADFPTPPSEPPVAR